MCAGKYWRDAGTVILAAHTAPTPSTGHYDYQVLLLQRSSEMKFHSESFVFPGGVVSSADADARWRHLFAQTGHTVEDTARALGNGAKGPPILVDSAETSGESIPKCISLRITAIRETFEECGVLLLISNSDAKSPPKMHKEFQPGNCDLSTWRKKVTSDPAQFLALCEELGAVPNVWSLADWNNWLTPVMKKVTGPPKKARRYDTMFFLCCMDSQPKVEVDGTELVSSQWNPPDRLMHKCSKGDIQCGVPQRYETLRMCHFPQLEKLCKFSHERAAQGLERILVVILLCADGMMALYPGDSLYPSKPDYEGFEGIASSDKTIQQLREESPHLNRMISEPSKGTSMIVCNLSQEQMQGHYRPMEEARVLEAYEARLSRL